MPETVWDLSHVRHKRGLNGEKSALLGRRRASMGPKPQEPRASPPVPLAPDGTAGQTLRNHRFTAIPGECVMTDVSRPSRLARPRGPFSLKTLLLAGGLLAAGSLGAGITAAPAQAEVERWTVVCGQSACLADYQAAGLQILIAPERGTRRLRAILRVSHKAGPRCADRPAPRQRLDHPSAHHRLQRPVLSGRCRPGRHGRGPGPLPQRLRGNGRPTASASAR